MGNLVRHSGRGRQGDIEAASRAFLTAPDPVGRPYSSSAIISSGHPAAAKSTVRNA